MLHGPPPAKVIWRRGHGLESCPTVWSSRGSNSEQGEWFIHYTGAVPTYLANKRVSKILSPTHIIVHVSNALIKTRAITQKCLFLLCVVMLYKVNQIIQSSADTDSSMDGTMDKPKQLAIFLV